MGNRKTAYSKIHRLTPFRLTPFMRFIYLFMIVCLFSISSYSSTVDGRYWGRVEYSLLAPEICNGSIRLLIEKEDKNTDPEGWTDLRITRMEIFLDDKEVKITIPPVAYEDLPGVVSGDFKPATEGDVLLISVPFDGKKRVVFFIDMKSQKYVSRDIYK